MHLRRLLLVFLFVLSVQQIFSQQPWLNPRYGSDSVSRMRCASNLSNVDQFVKINVIDYAVESWKYVFENCPQASKNIYIYGVRIFKYLLEKTTDENEKNRKLDSLILIYERRIQLYGEEGMVRGREALDVLKYSNRIDTAYRLLSRSIVLMKEQSEDPVVLAYAQVSGQMLKEGKISEETYMSNFETITDLLNKRLDSNPTDEKLLNLQESIVQIFQAGPQVSCESLAAYYTKKAGTNENKPDFLRNAISVLEKNRCTQSPVYERFLKKLSETDTGSASAYQLARYYTGKERFEDAVTAYQKAIEAEKNDALKARYYYQMELIEGSRLNQFKSAREHALKAAELMPQWGEPYILIGNLYAGSSKECGSNEFEQKAVFWAAVDKFIQASQVDPGLSEQAKKLISDYSKYLPNKEAAFFNGYTEGQTYQVGCWINEATRVRF
ncbi:MAG: hypothetical protein GYA22_14185 [Bacteroidales bacterium]|nr:hypothetical protein [Bacteroidales bacterium]